MKMRTRQSRQRSRSVDLTEAKRASLKKEGITLSMSNAAQRPGVLQADKGKIGQVSSGNPSHVNESFHRNRREQLRRRANPEVEAGGSEHGHSLEVWLWMAREDETRVLLNDVNGKKNERVKAQRREKIIDIERSKESGRVRANGLGVCW